jgi:hypothetical protein
VVARRSRSRWHVHRDEAPVDYAHWLVPAVCGTGFLLLALSYTRIIDLLTNLAPINMAVDNAVAVMAKAVERVQSDVTALTVAAAGNQDAEFSALAAKLQASVDALAASLK